MSRFYACLVSFIMRQNWSNQLVNCSNCLPLVNGSFSILVTMSDLEGLLRNIADSWSRTSIPEVWNRGWREREREREREIQFNWSDYSGGGGLLSPALSAGELPAVWRVGRQERLQVFPSSHPPPLGAAQHPSPGPDQEGQR